MSTRWRRALILLSAVAMGSEAYAQVFYSNKFPVQNDSGFRAGTGLLEIYNYNVFYDDERQLGDTSISVQPLLSYALKGSAVGLKATAEGNYEKFQTYSVQNHFDYKTSLEVPISFDNGYEGRLYADYKDFSDLAFSPTGKRYARNEINGVAELRIPITATKRVGLQGKLMTSNFIEWEEERFTRNTAEGIAFYEQDFLPETKWFVRGTAGMDDYPNGSVHLGDKLYEIIPRKFNNYYGLGEVGLKGRLTEKSSIDAAFGYEGRYYDDADVWGKATTFNEPIFYIRFIEQVSRRDQLIGGFNYVIQEALWSHYYTDQEIFLGLGRVEGDQLLLLSRLAYAYRTYSSPNRRDDQRLTASFAARFSLSPRVKLTADLQMDVLNSDPYNSDNRFPTMPPTDRAVSYRAGKASLGVLGEF